MRFLNGWKSVLGLVGVILWAAARTITQEPCTAIFGNMLTREGLDIGGGMALALLIVGLIHKAEKRGLS